jgi:LysM repeat protein
MASIGRAFILVKRPTRKNTMSIVTSSGRVISMLSNPPQITAKPAGAKIAQIDREGRKQLVVSTGPGQAGLSFKHTVASLDWTRSVESAVKTYIGLYEAGTRIRFRGGSPSLETRYWWRITSLEVNVLQRATNNSPSWVELSWELVEDYAVSSKTTAKETKSWNAKTGTSTSSAKKATTRTHKVKSGDSLWKIAAKYLGKGERWRDIYNLNKKTIKNPNRLTVGQTLKIPAK